MKKLFLSVLLLFTAILITAQMTYATPTSYTWNTETTHSFDYMDPNITLIEIDSISIFEYGVQTNFDYLIDFYNFNYLDYEYIKVTHKSTGHWRLISYDGLDYNRSGFGTYFDDKELTFIVDTEYDNSSLYHQVTYLNYFYQTSTDKYIGVTSETFFVEDGDVSPTPTIIPTYPGLTFQFWYNIYEIVDPYNFNTPIFETTFIGTNYTPTSVPTWNPNSSYGATDYDYYYYTSTNTTHTLDSTVLNYLTIYADGELIFNRGTTINDTAYTFNSGVGVELEITDVVNSTTSTFYSTGTITNNITTIDELVIIHSVSPQNIYVIDDETMHPFENMSIVEYDIYRNEDTLLKNSIINEDDYTLRFLPLALTISDSLSTFTTVLRYNESYFVKDDLDLATYTFIYTSSQQDFFDQSTTLTYGDVLVSISDGKTITITTTSELPQTFITDDLISYMNDLEIGKAYKITYDPTLIDYLSDDYIFNPIFINDRKNIELSYSEVYQNKTLVFEYTSTTQIFMKFNDVSFRNEDTTSFNLYIEEVLAHDVTFDTPSQLLYNQSRLVFMSRTTNLIAPQLDAFGGQIVEHYTQAIDPTFEFVEDTGGDWTVLDYYDNETGEQFDFDTPIVDDTELNPVIVPNYAFSIAFDSQGGSSVETQFLFDGDYVTQPVSPTKTGYTFDGWYSLPNMPVDIESPITELNNHSLREVFENTSLLDIKQLVTNSHFEDGNVGWGTTTTINANVSNSVYTFTATAQNGRISSILTVQTDINTLIYINSRIKTSSLYVYADGAYANPQFHSSYKHSGSGNYEIISGILITSSSTSKFQPRVIDNSASGWQEVQVDYYYAFDVSLLKLQLQYSPLYQTTFNLLSETQIKLQMDQFVSKPYLFIDYTLLGIDTLTVSQMDYYYSLYNYFLTGETPDLTDATLYDFLTPPTESTVLFAKWSENPPSTYTVSFNSVNGSYVAPTTVLDGGLITRPSDPYKEGYDFIGWSISIGGELFNFTETTVTEDMTLYALWEVPETPVDTDITDNETFNWFMDNWYYLAIGLVIVLVIFTPKRKVWKRR